ncbi:unnamed protein product [Soboliphyme baturini]|uniref:Uncharacterized protein n=1 Tax=Soboliphyme baturini TaxID=241478 RepID=A0A183IT70_9BILA|nr:unnamed protein product [Soboliphyme baturini]
MLDVRQVAETKDLECEYDCTRTRLVSSITGATFAFASGLGIKENSKERFESTTAASQHVTQEEVNLKDVRISIAWSCTGDISYKCRPYQLWLVGYTPTMVITGNGGSRFDSGEGA